MRGRWPGGCPQRGKKTGEIARDHYDQIAFRCRSLGAAWPIPPDLCPGGLFRATGIPGLHALAVRCVVEFEGKQHSTLVYDYDQTNPFRRDIRSGQWLDARDLVCQFLRHQMAVS